MKTFAGYVLTKILGWKIASDFPDIKKSITIFAPHTSLFDSVYGKLCFIEYGITHKFLSKKELFFFPLNLAMRWYGSIPIRGIAGQNAVYQVAKMMEEAETLHIILSPEGALAKVTKWGKGYYYMALKANVPIVVGFLDFKKKEIGVKGVIYDLEDINAVRNQINAMYKDVTAKCPDTFSLDLG